MIKKLGLTILTTVTILLIGCGGGGNSKTVTEKLKEKKAIFILQEVNSLGCTLLEKELKSDSDIKNPLAFSTSNNKSCTTYGREVIDINNVQGIPSKLCVELTLTEYLDTLSSEEIANIGDTSLYEDKAKYCVMGFNI